MAAWLHRVAWRKACNLVRGESRRRYHEQAAAENLGEMPEATWEMLEPLLDEVLEELPARLRELLVQHYLEGRTQQELAARMGVSQATVSRRLDAAVHELRLRLRTQRVICGAGLALLLSTNTAQAAPVSLSASLGKLALSGVGSSAAITPGAAFTSTFIAMTTTTKVLLATAAAAVIGFPIMMHQGQASGPPTPQRSAPASQSMSIAKAEPAAERPRYRPAPVSPQVRDAVEAILRRHKGMTKQQLKSSPELNQLVERFIEVLNTPEMQEKVEERMAAIRPVKGDENGQHMLRMDFEMLDDARGRAWLEAIVSGDTQRMQEWVLNTLDDAIFEFAFDPSLERTSNGVSMQPRSTETPGMKNKENEDE